MILLSHVLINPRLQDLGPGSALLLGCVLLCWGCLALGREAREVHTVHTGAEARGPAVGDVVGGNWVRDLNTQTATKKLQARCMM